jgi:hypothetical protein
VHHLSEPALGSRDVSKGVVNVLVSSIIVIHNCGKSGAETDVGFQ